MENDKYNKAIELLTSKEFFFIDLGLERIRKFLDILDNPQDRLKYVHVAGTNGKGSVCAFLNTFLQKNNLKVGLYTSPHIFEYTERIKINDECISKNELAEKIDYIIKTSNKYNIHLTEFEILTITAFLYFKEQNVDIVILETGLGGRFDATNVIKENLCSIITHIDLEHTDRLGKTIEEISFEKAGIIKRNCPVIIGEKNKIIEKIAMDNNSNLFFAQKTSKKSSLKNICQNANLSLALKACDILKIKVEDNYLHQVKNPCRFEYLKDYNIIVDVAHNPNSIKALRESLDKYYCGQNFNFIFGCLRTKDYKKMLKYLYKYGDKIYIYEFKNPNACNFEDFENITNCKILKFSKYKKDENITVICGSFYMLKELFSDMGIKYNINNSLS